MSPATAAVVAAETASLHINLLPLHPSLAETKLRHLNAWVSTAAKPPALSQNSPFRLSCRSRPTTVFSLPTHTASRALFHKELNFSDLWWCVARFLSSAKTGCSPACTQQATSVSPPHPSASSLVSQVRLCVCWICQAQRAASAEQQQNVARTGVQQANCAWCPASTFISFQTHYPTRWQHLLCSFSCTQAPHLQREAVSRGSRLSTRSADSCCGQQVRVGVV